MEAKGCATSSCWRRCRNDAKEYKLGAKAVLAAAGIPATSRRPVSLKRDFIVDKTLLR